MSAAFLSWADQMRPAWDLNASGVPVLMHRKLWEWLFITQALSERGLLRPGSRGLGFGVGQEPLVSFFANLGCSIVATDMSADQAEMAGWNSDDQFASSLDVLNKYKLCDPDVFRERVSYRTVDMNAIPSDLRDFDFTWSACAFEHLGSIERGITFIQEQMKCLLPGGVAVHTTEFNVDSNSKTIDDEMTVLFRKRDLKKLGWALRRHGHRVRFDFRPGETIEDNHVDVAPFTTVHLRTRVLEFATTSYGLIIQKHGTTSRRST